MVANHQPYIYIYIYTQCFIPSLSIFDIYIYNIHACSNLFRRPSRLAFKTGRNSNWIEFRRVVSVGNWVAIIHLNDITINNNDIISSWLFYGYIYNNKNKHSNTSNNNKNNTNNHSNNNNNNRVMEFTIP